MAKAIETTDINATITDGLNPVRYRYERVAAGVIKSPS